MHRSSTIARLVTAVFALAATPIAVGALSLGGSPWLSYTGNYMRLPLAEGPWPSLVWVALGMVLLLLVALSGIWSSAGLLVAGLWAVPSLITVLVPSLALEVLGAVGRALPGDQVIAVTTGFTFGVHALLTLPLSALGLVLVLSRRHPARSLLLALGGTVLAPLVLGAGLVLMLAGIAATLVTAIRAFELAPALIPTVAVLLGAVLQVLGLSMTRWAPFALLLPALAFAAVTVLFLTPVPFRLLESLADVSLGRVPVSDVVLTAQGAFLSGVGPGSAALFLGATVSVVAVRGRALRAITRGAAPSADRASSAPVAPTGAVPDPDPCAPAPGEAPPAADPASSAPTSSGAERP